uniref:Transposase n=1 Tax=Heterorhabditis bacteriophora TaxID=37862 RepID=A0A1I7XIR7_HETBA
MAHLSLKAVHERSKEWNEKTESRARIGHASCTRSVVIDRQFRNRYKWLYCVIDLKYKRRKDGEKRI